MTVKELKTITNLVKYILQKHSRARNSDDYLYLMVCEMIAREKGISLQSMNITNFFLHRSDMGFPQYKSVERAGRKLREKHPELCGEMDVEAQRELNKEAYEEYARAML